MRLRTAALVAGAGLFFACASPDDDSWEGAADDELGEGAGGSGGAPSTTKGATQAATNTATTGSGTTTAPSTTGANTSTVASTTSAVTTGGGCDVGTCEDCQGCALNGGPCTAAVDACFADTECYALLDCLSNCFDDACYNQCATNHQAGMPLYNTVGECVFCDVCIGSCGAC